MSDVNVNASERGATMTRLKFSLIISQFSKRRQADQAHSGLPLPL